MRCSVLGSRVNSSSTFRHVKSCARPSLLQRVRCQAKTTSSRNTRNSKSGDSSAANGAAPERGLESYTSQNASSNKRPAAASSKSLRERFNDILGYLTPKQEGDIGDVFMICLSMAVLVYLSMQLYRLYVYAYFTLNNYQNMMDMMR